MTITLVILDGKLLENGVRMKWIMRKPEEQSFAIGANTHAKPGDILDAGH
jgi:hypothetical protein